MTNATKCVNSLSFVFGAVQTIRQVLPPESEAQEIAGITYLPRIDRPAPDSRIETGRVKVSVDGEEWSDAGEFFFENLAEDPSRRTFSFEEPLAGKYIRLISKTCSVGSSFAGAADIDIIDADLR